jgi:glutamate dehydrogenase/leucine dehydrogenase
MAPPGYLMDAAVPLTFQETMKMPVPHEIIDSESATEATERLATAEHEDVLVVRRPRSGLHAILAIHSTRLGPSLGGVRFYPYHEFDAALHDVLRLSRGMTAKAALAGLDQGGGKSVILGDPGVMKSVGLIDDFAAAVDSLGGRYITAEDVGTTQSDMDRIRERTPYVGGTSVSLGGSGDPSPLTAWGVVCSMEAAAVHRWGADLTGRTVLILGTGKVGGEIVRLLVQRGARVVASDVHADHVSRAMRDGAVRLVEPSAALTTPADVLCPCALGGIITRGIVPELRFEMIVGAANNQLETIDVAQDLHDADILYVPDYLASAGGIINIAEEARGYDFERAHRAVERVGATTTTVLERARARGIAPVVIAEEIVAKRLADAS